MTELLLQKLEERMMLLLSEIEDLRKEVINLRSESSNLKSEKESNSKKLSDLLSLLDAVNVVDHAAAKINQVADAVLPGARPVSLTSVSLVERRESEFAQST